MSKFFNQLASEKLIIDWASTLDWLFDDLKFSKERNWNRGYTGLFTKRVRQLSGLSDKSKNFIYGKIKHEDFPNQIKGSRRKRATLIMIAQGDAIARDLIRHIRNGIAHGQTTLYKVKEELYIEIIDYSDKLKSPCKQTAFICIPLSYIPQFYKIYSDINTSIIKTKAVDRKLTKTHKED